MELYWYSKCSTCQKAKKYLDLKKMNYELHSIVNETPDIVKLNELIKCSDKDINKFFNTSGLKYRELNLKDKLKKLSYEDKLDLLASDGMLIKRPILIINDKVLVGFNEKEWSDLI